MNQTELIEFINEISENGVSYAHGKGFKFFRDVLLPNIEKAGKRIDENKLLADCWYVIGDIYDLNAVANIRKAITIEPADEYAITDLKDAENSLKNNEKPLYTKDNLIWKLSELIANQRFEEVIKITEKSTEINELKKMANAFGGLGKNEKYIAIWEKIEQSNSEFEIDYSDWFYMPDQVYESDKIWKILKRMNSRIKPSIFIQSNSLVENYNNLTDSDRRELMCDYQIFINTGNQLELSKLRLKYPNWKEIKTNANKKYTSCRN